MKIRNKKHLRNQQGDKRKFAAIALCLLMTMIMGSLFFTENLGETINEKKKHRTLIEEVVDEKGDLKLANTVSNICISEVYNNGSHEWIELYNPTLSAIDLTGWNISDPTASTDVADLSGTTIDPREIITVGDGENAHPGDDSPQPGGVNITDGIQIFGNDELILYDDLGNIIDALVIGDGDGGLLNTEDWTTNNGAPSIPDEWSLERVNRTLGGELEDNNNEFDWELTDTPTPWELAEYSKPPGFNKSLIISEVHYKSPEWIEIYNPYDSLGNLTGWQIVAEDGESADLSELNISAHGVITFGVADAPTDYNISIPSLNDGGDSLVLKNSTGDIQDAVVYGDINSQYNNTGHWNSLDTAYAPEETTNSIQRVNTTSEWGLEDNNLPSDWELKDPTPGSLPQFIPPGEAQSAGSVIITEIMIDPNKSEYEFEYIEVYNTLDKDLNFNGWQIWDQNCWGGTPIAEVSSAITLPKKSYFAFLADASEWDGEYGFNGLNSSFNAGRKLLNTGPDDVILTDPDKNIIDRVAWKTSDAFNNTIDNSSWVDDGVYIGGSSDSDIALTRLYNPEKNNEYLDTNSSKDWRYNTVPSLGKHSNNSIFLSTSIEGDAKITAFSSPDNSFAAFSKLIDSAKYNLDICVYQFTSYWILQEVLAALDRGVHVRLMLEGNYAGGSVNGSETEGSEMVYVANNITSHENGTVKWVEDEMKYLNYYHAKYFIIDNETTVISTENFKSTGIPKDPSAGNRGWGIAVNNTKVAQKFLSVYNFDWGLAHDLNYYDLITESKNDEILEGTYEPIFEDPQTYNATDATFQTVVGPDETIDVVVDLINNAQDSIYAELFYLYPTWKTYYGGQNNNPFMHALIDAAERGVTVKVILDSTWYTIDGDNNNDEAAAILKSHGVQVKYSNNSGGIEKFHVKALIVDEEAVMISSLNWNENSATKNREIGIIVNNSNVASYYVEIFNYDWKSYSALNIGEGKDEDGFLQTTTWLFWLPIASVLYVGILGAGYSVRRRKEKIQKKKVFARDKLREKKKAKMEAPQEGKDVNVDNVRQSIREMYGRDVKVPHMNEHGIPLDDIEPGKFVKNYIKHNHDLIEIGKYLTPIDRVAILKYKPDRYIAFDAETDLQSLLSTDYLKNRVKELEKKLAQKDSKMDSYMSEIGDIEEETERIKAKEDKGDLDEVLAEQGRKIQELKDKMFQIQKEKKALKEEMKDISKDQQSPLNELVADLQTKITKQKLLIKKLKEKEEKEDPFTFESSTGDNS